MRHLVGLILAISFLLASCSRGDRVEPPDALAHFRAKTSDGRTITEKDILGKPTVLVFAVSWCDACTLEFAFMDSLKSAWGDSLNLFIFTPEPESIFAKGYRFSIPYASVSKSVFQAFAVNSVPQRILLDKNGNELIRVVGADRSMDDEFEANLLGERR